jgi:hypothetical protein
VLSGWIAVCDDLIMFTERKENAFDVVSQRRFALSCSNARAHISVIQLSSLKLKALLLVGIKTWQMTK